MQRVSKAYRTSMESPMRERGYIMISFGLINQEAQRKAVVSSDKFTYFSNKNNLFDETITHEVYATLEENFTRVDGSMLFLPRETAGGIYQYSGIVSDNLVSQEPFEVIINLNIPATDFKGFTFDFGENYPVDFDIAGDNQQVIEIRGNENASFTTEEVLTKTTQVRLVFYAMKNPQSRVRIYSMLFGYGLIYHNRDVIDSNMESFVSPVSSELPAIDFQLTLKNYNRYFDVDNPKSAINFLETGQEMEIYYGYELPGSHEIEWIKGNHLSCSEWESDDSTVTLRACDVFRLMDGEYQKGTYAKDGVSYYDLAVAVMEDAGIENYYIDPVLKALYTNNPIPVVQHKEALQIIANACRCVLSQNRTGEIEMRSYFIPEVSAESTSQAAYANVENILDGQPKAEYADLTTDYSTVNAEMHFLPREQENYSLHTGYVSAEISDENGLFSINPTITVKQEIAFMYYGISLWFGRTLPSEFIVRTYRDGEIVAERTVSGSEIEEYTALNDRFDAFDTMTIEFVKTAKPYSRIVLNNFAFGSVTDFVMTRNNMTSDPRTIAQELIKDVSVVCYQYNESEKEDNLATEDVTVNAGEERVYYTKEPYYGFRCTLNNSTENVSILEQNSYRVKVRFESTGTFEFKLFGYPYNVVKRQVVKTLNARGKSIRWENPLISNMEMAEELAQWLSDYYYNARVEYEYFTRGNPEIDTGDVIYQENDFKDEMQVRVYRQTLTFNGSFGGKMAVRRLGG